MKRVKGTSSSEISKRLITCILIIAFFFVIAIGKLAYVQLIQGNELASKQALYTNTNIEITAARGDIYDESMNLLVQDAIVSRIYAFPASIEDADRVCSFLAEKLSMDYYELYGLLTDTSRDTVTVMNKVDNRTAAEIAAMYFPGIYVVEDKTRIYTDPGFAPYVLGFTGADHVGLYGVESYYESFLEGRNGVKSVLLDAGGNVNESSSTIKRNEEKGDSLVLTINSVAQYYAESAAYEAYVKYGAKRVIIIVTDPDTNAILAMAAYPAYSLDDPWEVSDDYRRTVIASDSMSEGDRQLDMWRSPFSSFMYEPGSTFKIVTCSSALEEGVVGLDSTFYCGGASYVSGSMIKCDAYPDRHGTQDLADAMANSCNVALMEIANLIGSDKFYRYIYDYGFGFPTGAPFDGEEGGILSANQDVNPIDFATLAFGQGIAATPIQMITALNAAINGGYLIIPRIVDRVIDPDTMETIVKYEPEVVRQVISSETSDTMRYILGHVADNYYMLQGYESYDIIGKTGTAEQITDGGYNGKLIASFYGALPENDPEISVLCIVDEPTKVSSYGSRTAAPTGAKLLANIYDYMKAKDRITPDDIKVASGQIIPDVRGYSSADAAAMFESLGIDYVIRGDGSGTVMNQDIYSVEFMEGMCVELTVSGSTGEGQVIVPNLYGMSIQKANEVLSENGLAIEIEGGGLCVDQSIEYGTTVERGTVVKLTFKYVEL